jgi:HEPN domain-containing protein
LADQGRMIKMWFRKSAQDLQTANLLLAQKSETFWGPLVFHAQQSTEKAIKGYLAFHKIRFSKTHDIEILVNLVAKVDEKLAEYLHPTKILTKYAVAYRYQEENEPLEPLTQENCEKITAMAESVFKKLNSLCCNTRGHFSK